MSVLKRENRFENIVDGDESFSLEDTAQCLDLIQGKTGEIRQRTFTYGFPVTIGFPKQNSGFGIAIGHNIDMHVY